MSDPAAVPTADGAPEPESRPSGGVPDVGPDGPGEPADAAESDDAAGDDGYRPL